MSRIIICIHGLGNKPPYEIYKVWWEKAILDGLKNIGYPRSSINMELVYWADILNPIPRNPFEKDGNSPFYVKEPYIPYENLTEEKIVPEKTEVIQRLKKQLKKIVFTTTSFLNIDLISDSIMRRCFTELNAYYYGTQKMAGGIEKPIKELVRGRLLKALNKHRKKEILLAAHSMGSMIAYDVMSDMRPGIKINEFITIGSPLGIPVILKKIVQERDLNSENDITVPECIQNAWYNMLDVNDIITLNHRLAGCYKANSRNVRVADIVVKNNYRHGGLVNQHKGYGYLVTEEFSGVVQGFLEGGRITVWQKLKRKLMSLFRLSKVLLMI